MLNAYMRDQDLFPMKLSFSKTPGDGLHILFVDDAGAIASSAYAQELKSAADAILWKKGKTQMYTANNKTFLLVGTGNALKDALSAREVGGFLFQALCGLKAGPVSVLCEHLSVEIVRAIGLGMLLRSWRFDKYHTAARPLPVIPEHTVCFVHQEAEACERAFEDDRCLAECIGWTRNLVNEPANVLFPKAFVDLLQPLADLGIKVEILDQKTLHKMGAHSLLGVACGSQHEPYIAILEWKGANKEAPLAFVGKGVTFDTGGISIKPANSMEEMKMDMTGAAVVCGLLRRLAHRKARVHAVGVVALVENMPSGSAQRPGDIVTSLSGQTIEVLNTDAEGRLILADALWLTQERFKPSIMIDLATLTGAICVALGSEFAGLFSEEEALVKSLLEAGIASGEKLWHMPLCEGYDKAMDGSISDLANIAPPGFGAGSSTAAQFLKRFTNGVPWGHLDIAGVEYIRKDTPVFAKGGAAFGLSLLDTWIRKHEMPAA